MANRSLGTYEYTTTVKTSFSMNFTGTPAAGSRIIVVVCSGPKAVTSFSFGWTMDVKAEGSHGLYVFSKIATGSESSFAWTISSNGSSQFAIAYERDGAPNVLFAGWDTAVSSPLAADVTVPAGASNAFVVAAVTAGSTTASPPSWPHGLSNDYDAWGSNSNFIEAFFASGTSLPSPGAASYEVVTTFSGNVIPLVVVGYGQADSVAPTVPGNLRTTAVTGTSFDVAWDASTDNIGVAGYGVWLNGTKQGADQTGLTRPFSGLTAGQSYLVEVDAVDGGGNRSGKAQLTVVTDGTPPTVPTGLTATQVTPRSATLTWAASTDNLGVAGYGVYVGAAKQGDDQDDLTRTVTGLTPGTGYTLGVDAVDRAGNRSSRATVAVTTPPDLPPTVPANLRVTGIAHTEFAVAWDTSMDDDALSGYGVYLNGAKQGPDQIGLSRVFTGLVYGGTYLVEVDAADTGGHRSGRASLSVTTMADTLPSVPPGFTATVQGTSVSLAWGAATDDLGIARYEVLLDGQVLAVTQGLAYVIDDLDAGGMYEVAVRAVDVSANRGPEAAETIVTPPPSYLPVASPIYRLGSWAANVKDEHGVTWVVRDSDGWSSTPHVQPLGVDSDSDDGGFAGPGSYGARTIILEGVAVAPNRVAMLEAQERLTGVLHPRDAAWLVVQDASLTRKSKVRLADQVEITDQGSIAFEWALTLSAADPRKYATRGLHVEADGVMPGTATATITLDGDYPLIPATVRVYGPVKDFTITHVELGLVIRSKPGTTISSDQDYSLGIDLGSRQVLAYVPQDVWPEPRPGRSVLASFPADFYLQPGVNTLVLSGNAIVGDPGRPRLVVEVADAWM